MGRNDPVTDGDGPAARARPTIDPTMLTAVISTFVMRTYSDLRWDECCRLLPIDSALS